MSQTALQIFISACITLVVLVVGGCTNETGDPVEYPDVDREDKLPADPSSRANRR